MKQVKFLMVALTILMGTMVTSCMESEPGTPTAAGPVEVISSMGSVYFKDATGLTIFPSAASLAAVETKQQFKPSSTNMAYVVYTYNMDDPQNANAVATKKLVVELSYAVSLDATVEDEVQKGGSNDSISTAPIISIDNVMEASGTNKDFFVMNGKYLFCGIRYFFYEKNHNFTLVRYDADVESTKGEIKFYLKHSGSVEKDGVSTTSLNALNSGYPFAYFHSFNIATILRNYKMNTGDTSVKIVVEADVRTTDNKLDSAEKKLYSLDYKFED